MRNRLSVSILALFFAALCFVALPVTRASDANKNAKVVTFNKDVAPILLQELRRVPSRGRNRADVFYELQRGATRGQSRSKRKSSSARCRRGTPTRITASSQTTAGSLRKMLIR